MAKSLYELLCANIMYVRTILHDTMEILSFAKVQYLHTSITVLTSKYFSLDTSKLMFIALHMPVWNLTN